MADEYSYSAPCLLDELMDNQVITCDIDFGSADPVFAVKKSPSHESDSGCSDMTEERSVSPLVDVGEIGFPELEGFSYDPVSCELETLNNELDQELESYLNSPVRERSDIPAPITDFRSAFRKTRAAATVTETSPVSDSDSDPDYEPHVSRKMNRPPIVHTKSKEYVATPLRKTDICVLPTRPKVNNDTPLDRNNNSQARPTVKVVKVIKTPTSTGEDLGDQLMQALDERNRKNAKQAKINREKKKNYIKNLEDEISSLKMENDAFREQQTIFVNEKKEMQEEIDYLKSVLANQSALSGLLNNIGNVRGVKLSSSFIRKRNADLDHDYHNDPKRRKMSTAGVCLHVDDGNVSLEFCSKCAHMAKSGAEEAFDNS